MSGRRAGGFAAVALLVAGALFLGGARRPALAAPPVPATPRSVFAARRARLAERLPASERPFICESGRKPAGEHDVDFRVASDFFYLTGVDVPGAALLLWRAPDGVHDVLLLPKRSARQKRWESPFLHVGDPRVRDLGFSFTAPSDRATRARILQPLKKPAGQAAIDVLVSMRQVKGPHELARIREAIAITGRAITEAMRSVEPGQNERELEALLRYVFRREGAARAAFPVICASGPNGCVLHYERNERTMRAGELVLCDVGAELGRYAADVTRTFPVSGRFSPRQRELYEAVLAAQAAAIAAVRPGATLRRVHEAALQVLKARGLAKHYPHGTSHWLGLDVHDVGSDRELEPGMVLTVEPGVYLDDEGIGIRIEDDVLVTEGGSEVLSRQIPRAVDAIERLQRERGLGNRPLAPYPPFLPAREAAPKKPGSAVPF